MTSLAVNGRVLLSKTPITPGEIDRRQHVNHWLGLYLMGVPIAFFALGLGLWLRH